MRYRLLGLLILLSEVLFGQTPGLGIPMVAGGTFTIALTSDSAVSAAVMTAMQREVEEAMAPSNIALNWKETSQVSSEVYQRLARVRMRGNCQTGAPIPSSLRVDRRDMEALGQTQVVDGKVLPIADVQCDSVRKLIDRDLRFAPRSERDELLGRALGRVMAHELYHVLLRTREHGRNGLARPAQNSAQLLAPRNAFAPEQERRLAQMETVPIESYGTDSGR